MTTDHKAPENNDDRPKIEKKAAQAAIENAEKPTMYLNSGLPWYEDLTSTTSSSVLAFFLVRSYLQLYQLLI